MHSIPQNGKSYLFIDWYSWEEKKDWWFEKKNTSIKINWFDTLVLSVTWSILCKDIPEEHQEFAEKLEHGELSAEMFVLSPEFIKKVYLGQILGEGYADVIEHVIKAANKVSNSYSLVW